MSRRKRIGEGLGFLMVVACMAVFIFTGLVSAQTPNPNAPGYTEFPRRLVPYVFRVKPTTTSQVWTVPTTWGTSGTKTISLYHHGVTTGIQFLEGFTSTGTFNTIPTAGLSIIHPKTARSIQGNTLGIGYKLAAGCGTITTDVPGTDDKVLEIKVWR